MNRRLFLKLAAALPTLNLAPKHSSTTTFPDWELHSNNYATPEQLHATLLQELQIAAFSPPTKSPYGLEYWVSYT